MSGRDLGASVRQRLLNQARSQGRPFQELLQYFAMERFLYRLAKSPFADRFILKGALLLTAWRAPVSRPTMDIDLAGKTNNELEHIRSLVGEVCEFATEPDGIDFVAGSIEVQRIKEDAEYEGVRVRFNATLARARIPMQIDIGFGDVIVPRPVEIEYPAMLEFPAPVLMAYSKETVVAEKLEALTVLGLLNSRIKDYYDIALLARLYSFDGDLLAEAIRSTFRHRGTMIDATPVGLTDAFSADPARVVQWRAFVRRSRFESESGLDEIVAQVRRFASAPLTATAREDPLSLENSVHGIDSNPGCRPRSGGWCRRVPAAGGAKTSGGPASAPRGRSRTCRLTYIPPVLYKWTHVSTRGSKLDFAPINWVGRGYEMGRSLAASPFHTTNFSLIEICGCVVAARLTSPAPS